MAIPYWRQQQIDAQEVERDARARARVGLVTGLDAATDEQPLIFCVVCGERRPAFETMPTGRGDSMCRWHRRRKVSA